MTRLSIASRHGAEILRLYRAGMTLTAIGLRFDVTHHVISDALRAYGRIPTKRVNMEPDERQQGLLHGFAKTGISISKASKALGVSKDVARRWLVTWGIPTQSIEPIAPKPAPVAVEVEGSWCPELRVLQRKVPLYDDVPMKPAPFLRPEAA